MPPIVLVTTDRRDLVGFKDSPRVRPRRPEVWLDESYVQAVRDAGGVPVLAPPGEVPIDALLARVDAVLLTGGHFDIHPSLYGAEVSGRLDRVEPDRTSLELGLAAACLTRGVPVLGICGGVQAMAVAAGGTLIQDLPRPPHGLEHEQPTDPATPWHPVRLDPGGARWLGAEVDVNSTHHQAVATPGAGLEACGWSPDGAVEMIWAPEHPFAVGVQWHPELLGDLRLYRALIEAARPLVIGQ